MHAKDSMSERFPDAAVPGRKCPLCGKSTEQKFRPFCSKRCADLDLGRWLKGDYAIAVAEDSARPSDAGDEGDDGAD